MKKPGQVIEKYQGLHFQTEVRFNRSDGIFSAELPDGLDRIKDQTLDGVREKLRAFDKTYEQPGGWRRMIYVQFNYDNARPREERSHKKHHIGSFVAFDTQTMSMGYDLFEERENNPKGKRICRRWMSDAERNREPSWGVKKEDDRGRDERHYLEDGEDSDHLVMEWTEEREAALVEIQKAIGTLSKKLKTVLERPELVSGMLPMLTSGGKK